MMNPFVGLVCGLIFIGLLRLLSETCYSVFAMGSGTMILSTLTVHLQTAHRCDMCHLS